MAWLTLVAPSAFAQAASPGAAPAAATAQPAAPRKPLAVDEVVARALRHNPSRGVATLAGEQARQNVLIQEGRYPYVFGADAGATRTRSPRLGPNDSVSASTSRSVEVGAALRRTFPIGTSAELRVAGEAFDQETSSLAGPATGYGVSARASVTHPLLRGAGTRVGEVDLRAARLDRVTADRTLRRVTSETVRDALLRYWELWYAEAALEIERAALELAREQEREAALKVEQGALALADSFAFSTRVAELEESLVMAENTRTQRALDLSVSLGDPSLRAGDAMSWSAASELPEPGPLATPRAVEAALAADSIELGELENDLRVAAMRAEVAGESSRTRLDVEGYLENQGLGERVTSAAERAFGSDYFAVHVGIVAEVPLDGSRFQAERTGALLAVRIAEQNLRAARVRLEAEAQAAVESESASVRRLALSRRTLEVAEKAYAAESARFELGQTIPIQVRQAEDELRRARLRVTRARVDVILEQVAIAHLEGKLIARYARG